MGKRGSNIPILTLYDYKILDCLIKEKRLKIGEIEEKTEGNNHHIRKRIDKLKEYNLLNEDNSEKGKAIFISINQENKPFVRKFLNFFRGKIPQD